MSNLKVFFVVHFLCSISLSSDASKAPNIVFILTDDQDVFLGGLVSMTTKTFPLALVNLLHYKSCECVDFNS